MTSLDEALPALDDPDRFDRRRAAHLLRRSGFGARPIDIDRCLDDGLEVAVDRIVAGVADPVPELDAVADTMASGDIEGLQSWWVARMLRSDDPLREKLALFWHGHFATSDDKVDDPRLMLAQLRIFLELGRGPFADILRRVAIDPAMLVWLDGERNQRGHPNENFARELFELFTLGIGHYTEVDVQQAARAFTGWRRAGGGFEFVAGRHDDGTKTVLGRTGRFGAEDVLDLCLEHPAASRHLTRRLLRFFAEAEPPGPLVTAVADAFLADDMHVGRLLRGLFTSRYFYSDAVVGRRIQSPVEFVVGYARTLTHRVNAKAAAALVATLGQSLLRPPSVKGWVGEDTWIHAASMAARVRAASRLARDRDLCLDLDPDAVFGRAPRDRRELATHVLRGASIEAESSVVDALAEHLAAVTDEQRSRSAIAAALSLPEASIG